jgi:replicative DNA helicase
MEKSSYKSNPLPITHISTSIKEELEYIEARKNGKIKSLRTPWKKYNRVSMGGLEWHTIHTIGGMSGSGKTAILNQLETEIFTLNSWEEFDVLSFNFEMLARNLVGRKLSNELDLTVQDLHSGIYGETLSDVNFDRVKTALPKFDKLPIYYVEQAGSVNHIMDTIFEFSKQQKFKTGTRDKYKRGLIVLLDHTILVQGRSDQQERNILVDLYTRVNHAKKWFYANQRQVTFVFLTQLNRSIEETDRITDPSLQFPKKKDIFGGDACFQFSDVVMVSMNPEQNGLESYGPKGWPSKGFLYWHFLKVREGTPIVARMENKLAFNRVVDYEPTINLSFDTTSG